jgi:oxygen-independent coproporphyrinogen-3 oxidase
LAGIYIHIPYCKSICNYCDFYKTANIKNIIEFIDALIVEIEIKKDLITEKIETVYFGGGTPSVLSTSQIKRILEKLNSNYNIENGAEFTIEVNPDDISSTYLYDLFSIGFNRLSIGIQSFDNSILRFINRRHSAEVARESISMAKDAGFRNISLDLIYGIYGQTIESFKNDLEIINQLNISHLSAYHLGIEENSYFGKLKKLQRFIDIPESESVKFYNALVEWASESNFEHYEVSNFAKDSMYSKHNKSYWVSIPYLGFGPSAHSYNLNKRFYNVNNVNEYIKLIKSGQIFYEEETLSEFDKFNEYLLLRLRTKWGINVLEMNLMVDDKILNKIMRRISLYNDSDYLRIENGNIILTEKGFMISDSIIRDLFIC